MSTEQLNLLRKHFQYYQVLAERTFRQINDNEFFYRQSPHVNSIATLVKHLAGNILSRWTAFLKEDGEKNWRNRDTEFDLSWDQRTDYQAIWDKAWQVLYSEYDQLEDADLKKTIYIRNQPLTVPDALFRQLSHLSYHLGQIVFQAKILKGEHWKNLSIPYGQSEQFNRERSTKPGENIHFIDEFLKDKS